MINFDFCSPTKIYFGKNREKELGSILKKQKCTKVLLHYGKSSIKELGLYEKSLEIKKIIKDLPEDLRKRIEELI